MTSPACHKQAIPALEYKFAAYIFAQLAVPWFIFVGPNTPPVPVVATRFDRLSNLRQFHFTRTLVRPGERLPQVFLVAGQGFVGPEDSTMNEVIIDHVVREQFALAILPWSTTDIAKLSSANATDIHLAP